MSETAVVETTTEAVKESARRAPLLAGSPEISIGLEGFDNTSKQFEFTNNEFRILQLSDVQTEEGLTRADGTVIDNGITRYTINAIQNAIRSYKPDLIVMTGDQIGAGDSSTMSEANLQVVANHYASIIKGADPNVKFALVMGNHDPKLTVTGVGNGTASTQAQYDAFKEAFGGSFVDYDVASLAGTGNGKIDVYASDSVAARVFLFDTQQTCIGASSGETAGSDNRAIVDWYSSNATVPNVVFQHIVPNEIALYGSSGAWLANGLMTGTTSTDAGTYGGIGSSSRLTLASGASGALKETPCPYGTGKGQYATKQQFIAMADHQCKGVFFGHDHVNSYGGPVTVYGKTVNFYNTPGMTQEEYYDPPAVRTITLTKSGSSVTLSTTVKDMEQLELDASATRVNGNETGIYDGGVPASETVAVPRVLYKGAAANNTDPINNQSFGDILQQYVYNYETVHLDAANTSVRFVLPSGASGVTISAKKSTATGTTVNMSGTSLSMTALTSTTLANGSKLYTSKLGAGADLSSAYDVVFAVAYTLSGSSKTIYGVSCVEDLKIPAGYAVEEGPYISSDYGSSTMWNTMLQQKYLFTISGDNVYGKAANAGSDYWGKYYSDGGRQGYSNGWLSVFSSKEASWGTGGAYHEGGSEPRYALAYHGYNLGDSEADQHQVMDGNKVLQYSMNLNADDGNTRAPESIIYIDKSATPIIKDPVGDDVYDYGAVLTFSQSFIPNVSGSGKTAGYAKNIRDYPTYISGIGFANVDDGVSNLTKSGQWYLGDSGSGLGRCARSGWWCNHDRYAGNGLVSGGSDSGTTGKAEVEKDIAGTAGNHSYDQVFARPQSLNYVTTEHYNGNTRAENLIPNNDIVNYRLISKGLNQYADHEERMGMIIGTRSIRPWYNDASTNTVVYSLQAVSLTLYVYDKGDLRSYVEQEMRAARSIPATSTPRTAPITRACPL